MKKQMQQKTVDQHDARESRVRAPKKTVIAQQSLSAPVAVELYPY